MFSEEAEISTISPELISDVAGIVIVTTPAATATDPPTADNFVNVTTTAIITVPKGCCFTVAVENVSTPVAAGDVAPAILVQNANLTVSRIA